MTTGVGAMLPSDISSSLYSIEEFSLGDDSFLIMSFFCWWVDAGEERTGMERKHRRSQSSCYTRGHGRTDSVQKPRLLDSGPQL